jgi:hypothetical protein
MILLADPHATIVQETVYPSDAPEAPKVADLRAILRPRGAAIAVPEILYAAAMPEASINFDAPRLSAKTLE